MNLRRPSRIAYLFEKSIFWKLQMVAVPSTSTTTYGYPKLDCIAQPLLYQTAHHYYQLEN
eukprot:822458-Pyramimonas_sp.AAC.1